MKFFDKVKNWCQKFSGEEAQTSSIEASVGDEEDLRLSSTVIYFDVQPLSYLQSEEFLSLVSDEFSIAKSTIRQDIARISEILKEDLQCVIEFPYVEPFFRDTYYTFFSKKHNEGLRSCFRISLYPAGTTLQTFSQGTPQCCGYFILRPTPIRTLGYTFIDPQVLRAHDFQCCISSKTISVGGHLMRIKGFPFSSQDGESISCAETTLIMLMDYFSMRYAAYRQLFPSQIAKMLAKHSHERQFPTHSLAQEEIAHVLLKLGFGIRVYFLGEDPETTYLRDEFLRLFRAYIESGFPIVTCKPRHTFLTIGMENDAVGKENPLYVINNDNNTPYQLEHLPEDVNCFMVPLSSKTFLDAECVKPFDTLRSLNSKLDLNINISEKENKITRIFLTTSRSFKAHIRNQRLRIAESLIGLTMPKFVWVVELIDPRQLSNHNHNNLQVDTLLLYDATGSKSSDNYFIAGRIQDKFIYLEEDESQYRRKNFVYLEDVDDRIRIFDRNLKGDHNQWQE